MITTNGVKVHKDPIVGRSLENRSYTSKELNLEKLSAIKIALNIPWSPGKNKPHNLMISLLKTLS